jgi:hypothetical protein
MRLGLWLSAVALVTVAAGACSGHDSAPPTTPTPVQQPKAIVSLAVSAQAERQPPSGTAAAAIKYTVKLSATASGAGVTLSAAEFWFVGGSPSAAANGHYSADAALPAHLPAGGTVEREIVVVDSEPGHFVAGGVSATIRFVDDNLNQGSTTTQGIMLSAPLGPVDANADVEYRVFQPANYSYVLDWLRYAAPGGTTELTRVQLPWSVTSTARPGDPLSLAAYLNGLGCLRVEIYRKGVLYKQADNCDRYLFLQIDGTF